MVAAIVLAAGMSTRMGSRNKLLLPLGNTTFIEKTVDTLLASYAGEVIVVLGHEQEKIRLAIGDRKVVFTENPDYKIGMTTSIQAGVRAASPAVSGYMICLSDMPLLTANDLNLLVTAFESSLNPHRIIIPSFQKQRGNPVIFSSSFREEILTYTAPNGCKGIVQKYSGNVILYEMSNDNVLKDVDTEEGYKDIC
jgi:molybdenum cofactor cytidylyltransferase